MSSNFNIYLRPILPSFSKVLLISPKSFRFSISDAPSLLSPTPTFALLNCDYFPYRTPHLFKIHQELTIRTRPWLNTCSRTLFVSCSEPQHERWVIAGERLLYPRRLGNRYYCSTLNLGSIRTRSALNYTILRLVCVYLCLFSEYITKRGA